PRPVLRHEADTDWEKFTRELFPPLAVGERWFLVPPWSNDPTPCGCLRLEVNPGMACGTGWHPCTQLCLEALERVVKPGDAVLDVGTGSGILSQAAAMLGAGHVYACDIDFDAILLARERVRLPAFGGSAGAVRAAAADIIVANISSEAAEELASEFRRVLRPYGTLIVSGFEAGDLPGCYASC